MTPKGKPLLLGLCLHGIYMAYGVSTDQSGRLAAKDGTEWSVRMRDPDSHPGTAGHVTLCASRFSSVKWDIINQIRPLCFTLLFSGSL